MHWSSLFVGLGGVLIIFIAISLYRNNGFEKLQSAMKKTSPSPNPAPTPSDTQKAKVEPKEGGKKSQILLWAGAGVILLLVLWFGYHEWERRTLSEEQKNAAARQEALAHPPMYRDSLTLTREWSEWIKPDSLFRPNNTHAGWMFPGDVALEIQDARGRIFKEGPHSHKRVDYAINQDSLRFRTPKRDSTWFILTLTPIQ